MKQVSINLTVDRPGAGQTDTIINLTNSDVTLENVQVIIGTLESSAMNFPNEDLATKYQLDLKIEDVETGAKFTIVGENVTKADIEEVVNIVGQATNETTTTTTEELTTTTTIV